MRVITLNTGRTVRAAQPALLEGDGGAGGLEDDVELVLLLGGRGLTGTGTRCGNRGDRGRGGDVEGLLELLDELRELEQRHLLERVEQVVARQLRHDASYFLSLLPADRPR